MDDSDIIKNSQLSAKHGEFYENRWSEIESWQGSYGYGQIRVEFIEYVINKYIQNTSLSILDLGCGTGWLSKTLSQFGTVDGVDFSRGLIEEASNKYGEYGNFYLADATSPTFGLKSHNYDLVISTEVIEHVEDHVAFVKQLKSFLNPNGWLILTTENKAFYDHTMNDPRTNVQPIENWLEIDELRDLLTQFDFEINTHIGYADARRFDYTFLSRYIGSPRIWNTLRRFGLQHTYGRLILSLGKYQLLIAQLKHN